MSNYNNNDNNNGSALGKLLFFALAAGATALVAAIKGKDDSDENETKRRLIADKQEDARHQAVVNNSVACNALEENMLIEANEDTSDDDWDDLLDEIEDDDCSEAYEDSEMLKKAENLYLECRFEEAFTLFSQLAERGNGRAMYYMSEFYLLGLKPYNQDKISYWRTCGAEAGDVLALLNMAFEYPENSSKRSEIMEEMLPYVQELAENGDIMAQSEYSAILLDDLPGKTDIPEGMKWLIESAKKGFWFSQNELGTRYHEGNCIEENDVEAVKWFRIAAESGYSEAQFNLAECYYFGYGIEEDESTALQWYQKAAQQGCTDAIDAIKKYYS